jgi:hypothetical protein
MRYKHKLSAGVLAISAIWAAPASALVGIDDLASSETALLVLTTDVENNFAAPSAAVSLVFTVNSSAAASSYYGYFRLPSLATAVQLTSSGGASIAAYLANNNNVGFGLLDYGIVVTTNGSAGETFGVSYSFSALNSSLPGDQLLTTSVVGGITMLTANASVSGGTALQSGGTLTEVAQIVGDWTQTGDVAAYSYNTTSSDHFAPTSYLTFGGVTTDTTLATTNYTQNSYSGLLVTLNNTSGSVSSGTPAPEPASMAVLLTGVVGCLGLTRRASSARATKQSSGGMSV